MEAAITDDKPRDLIGDTLTNALRAVFVGHGSMFMNPALFGGADLREGMIRLVEGDFELPS